MISLIHPSRGRPEQANATVYKWLEVAGTNVEYILSIDEDDPTKEEYLNWAHNPIIGNNDCVVKATNRAAAVATGDILVYLSDDFSCPYNWALLIEEIAKQYKDEFLIKVNDGIQRFENDMLTIPIMSRKLYQRLGYFWYPAYKSIYCDNDLYYTCKRYGWLKKHPELLFKHSHPCNGTAPNDPTYIRSHLNYDQGKKVFDQRKKENFR